MSNTRLITIGELAKEINRSVATIKNWYEWAERHDKLNELPVMRRDIDKKGTRYFSESDIPKFIEFRENVTYGMMADVSREKWGKRGEPKEASNE